MKNLFIPFALFAIIHFANAQTKSIVYFDSNKSDLKSEAIKVLDSLLHLPSDIKIISIDGYCDNTGNAASNQILSENRANEVANYFKKKNLSSSPISVKGSGEASPISNNSTEEGKAKNRRVEITVIGMETEPIRQTAIMVPTKEEKKVVENKKTFNEKSSLTDLEVGKTLVLKNLNFEGGTAILLPEGKPTLEMLLKIMQDNPTLEIEIGGHVCCFDDMPLSVLRAQSVYKYLIGKGIKAERMTYKGYSRNKPIYQDDKDEFRARANRRVEITVLKK